jgi:hypothetical protein
VISEEIMNFVWEENRVFLTEKYAHDDDFFKVRSLHPLRSALRSPCAPRTQRIRVCLMLLLLMPRSLCGT